jgi:hypothetical protein
LETSAGDFLIPEKNRSSTTAMNTLPAAPTVSFENRLVKPIAESHITRHSGHFGRNVRAIMEAPDVPAANSRFLLVLLFICSHAFTV